MDPDRKADPDGDLVAARTRFDNAVSALVDRKPRHADGRILWVESLHRQLLDALAGVTRERSGGAGSLPLWPAAFDLLQEISASISEWMHHASEAEQVIAKLQLIAQLGWRPQDARQLERWSADIESWCQRIDRLLDPPRDVHLTAPCPNCNVQFVHRTEDGETTRRPALQIVPGVGCQCQNCRYVWEPYRYHLLADALNCPLPPGVLE